MARMHVQTTGGMQSIAYPCPSYSYAAIAGVDNKKTERGGRNECEGPTYLIKTFPCCMCY